MSLAGEILRARRRSAGKAVAVPHPSMRALTWSAVTVTAAVCGLALCLFLILPRTAQAAFRHLRSPRTTSTGFGRVVDAARPERLPQPNYTVFHVRQFTGGREVAALKWRGVVLADFDGRRWSAPGESGQVLRPDNGLIRVAENEQRRRPGVRISYEVRLRSVISDALFLAGMPEFLQLPVPYALMSSTGVIRPGLAALDGLRYGVHAFVEAGGLSPGEVVGLDPEARQRYLRLPETDPRVARLAVSLAAPEAIETYLRSQYAYSLEGARPTKSDPVAAFLFERKSGHCEEFASAMAVLLRLKSIPARVVTGFQNARYNPLTGYYMVPASGAHAWVEAWLEGKGWTEFDATPANPAAMPPWLMSLSNWADAADSVWQDWVLGYNLESQLGLAARLEQRRYSLGVDWREALRIPAGGNVLLAIGIGALLLSGAVWAWRWRRNGGGAGRFAKSTRLYAKFLALMKRRGFERPAWMTPAEFAAGIAAGELRGEAERFTRAYYAARFGGEERPLAEMHDALKKLAGDAGAVRRV
jgi:transglutaminase-like putative cysteine protease